MPKYVVDTDELRNAADNLRSKAEEMRTATNNLNQFMNTVRDMQAPRIERFVESWDELKSQFDIWFENMEETLSPEAINIAGGTEGELD